ncbi:MULTISPECIES: cupin domain-containing protein [unclassified Acinetobacter]|uniref:cupin domain-containing protein n=1 Tax=unclassified Acinetobacter TaxID=196816 RepID=UPI0029351202|nr:MULTISPECIES: cupin domain-containing protein [unclassified Acinetobacter]WOE31836.1 cupin domain-containing protein [Acinetobacter sp. SAAs470]WOE37303.1 cupin domain-containing protein [Acinetobacter sp. SAAs474]
MRIHADFSQMVMMKPENYRWVKSLRGEVDRVMLDRIGNEYARATSLVQYPAKSTFPIHRHPLGEEILVLSGTFTENNQDHYPEGWYLRNPHNSLHQASSEHGTLLFVKLMQMSEQEQNQTRINTNDPLNWISLGNSMRCPLYQSEFEMTYLEKLEPNQKFKNLSNHGIELLILKGELNQGREIFPVGTWIRLPPQQHASFQVGHLGATLYIKTGHLSYAQQQWLDQK